MACHCIALASARPRPRVVSGMAQLTIPGWDVAPPPGSSCGSRAGCEDSARAAVYGVTNLCSRFGVANEWQAKVHSALTSLVPLRGGCILDLSIRVFAVIFDRPATRQKLDGVDDASI